MSHASFQSHDDLRDSLGWEWKDVLPRHVSSDAESEAFRSRHMPFLIHPFERSGDAGVQAIAAADMDTNRKRVRVHLVHMESHAENAFAFLRNENKAGVENWGVNLKKPQVDLDHFIEFSEREYKEDYGGFLADVFTVKDGTLISAGFGTNAFAKHTNRNTEVLSLKDGAFYLVRMNLGKVACFSFAMEIF